MNAASPTIHFDPEGRLTTRWVGPGPSITVLPYHPAHHCARTAEDLTSAAPAFPMPATCPLCGATLFLSPGSTYCLNVHCGPRRFSTLQQQLTTLGVACTRPLMVSLIEGICSVPGFDLTTLLVHPKLSALIPDLRALLAAAELDVFLRLIGVPETYAEQADTLAALGHRTPQALVAAVASGALYAQRALVDCPELIDALVLSIGHINTAFVGLLINPPLPSSDVDYLGPAA